MLVGYERSRVFLQAEDSVLRRGTGAAAKHRQRPACSQRLIKVVQNNVASEVAVDSSLSGRNLIHALFHGCRSKTSRFNY